jgi:hypothetical protein
MNSEISAEITRRRDQWSRVQADDPAAAERVATVERQIAGGR